MTPQTTPVHINPSDETIHLGPLAVRFLVTGADASGSVALFELTVPGAQRLAAPAHSHDHYEETIYGIEGVLSWTVDGTRIDVGPGQALCIPRGAVHRFDNHGSQDVKALCAITPAAIGPQFFRESAAVINAAAGGPPDRVKMADIMPSWPHPGAVAASRKPSCSVEEGPMQAVVVAPGGGRFIAVGSAGTGVTVKVSAAETDGSCTVWEGRVPPGTMGAAP